MRTSVSCSSLGTGSVSTLTLNGALITTARIVSGIADILGCADQVDVVGYLGFELSYRVCPPRGAGAFRNSNRRGPYFVGDLIVVDDGRLNDTIQRRLRQREKTLQMYGRCALHAGSIDKYNDTYNKDTARRLERQQRVTVDQNDVNLIVSNLLKMQEAEEEVSACVIGIICARRLSNSF